MRMLGLKFEAMALGHPFHRHLEDALRIVNTIGLSCADVEMNGSNFTVYPDGTVLEINEQKKTTKTTIQAMKEQGR